MDSWFSSFTTSPLTTEPAADVNPFVALERLQPAVAERIATALCYADDVHTLCRCLSFGDRLVGRVEYFAVKSATSAWLDGAWLEGFGFREGLECKETFGALQEAASAYLDELDTRKPVVALNEKWG